PDAHLLHRLGGGDHIGLRPGAESHVGSLGGEALDDRPPDAIRAAGDQRPPSSQLQVHAVPPPVSAPPGSLWSGLWRRTRSGSTASSPSPPSPAPATTAGIPTSPRRCGASRATRSCSRPATPSTGASTGRRPARTSSPPTSVS